MVIVVRGSCPPENLQRTLILEPLEPLGVKQAEDSPSCRTLIVASYSVT